METIEMNEETIAKLEAAGGKRWTKHGKDRIYFDAKVLGLEVKYNKTGSINTAKWQGETITNSDGYRLNGSKVYVDVATGELHVETSTDWSRCPELKLENVAEKFVENALADEKLAERVETEAKENARRAEDVISLMKPAIREKVAAWLGTKDAQWWREMKAFDEVEIILNNKDEFIAACSD